LTRMPSKLDWESSPLALCPVIFDVYLLPAGRS
jgi:hypothetical protein